MVDKEVIIMGIVLEEYYDDNIYDVEKRIKERTRCAELYRSLDQEIPEWMNTESVPEVIREQRFLEYEEIIRSSEINPTLKENDLIYIPEDNRNYTIVEIATDLDGNTIYFIDKVVTVVKSDDIEESKQKAQKRVDEWISINNAKKIVDKEVKKMDSWWKIGRKFLK